MSPLANTERLRLRHLALCKDCRTGIYGYEVSLQACRVAGGLGDREWGSATFILSQGRTCTETGLAVFLEIIWLPLPPRHCAYGSLQPRERVRSGPRSQRWPMNVCPLQLCRSPKTSGWGLGVFCSPRMHRFYLEYWEGRGTSGSAPQTYSFACEINTALSQTLILTVKFCAVLGLLSCSSHHSISTHQFCTFYLGGCWALYPVPTSAALVLTQDNNCPLIYLFLQK